MTEERRVQHKLSVARACRRLAAKFRRGETSADYQRYQRAADHSEEAAFMRRERAAEQVRRLGGGF